MNSDQMDHTIPNVSQKNKHSNKQAASRLPGDEI
jgi:hypothetical protein